MYSEAQETLINLFEDALVLGKRFKRDVYSNDFETCYIFKRRRRKRGRY